jgi:hypothetical protein
MKVITEPATINNIKFILSGNHDNGDLTYVYLYYNATAPVISGASYLGYANATYPLRTVILLVFPKLWLWATRDILIIAVSLANNATDNHTVVVNGATDPMEFAFTTDPNVTD